MADDREEFANENRVRATELAADDRIRALDLDLTAKADERGYSYLWSWLGVPIIQMPADIVTVQEIIWATKPDVIVETGVARGGSCLLHASMLKLLGSGRVVAVDIEIRPHNRKTIEEHPVGDRVTLIEGSSIDPATIEAVQAEIAGLGGVMVVLDSDHSHEHVLAELRAYAPLVTPGHFLVVADTVVGDIPRQAHRRRSWGPGDNPRTALDAFLGETDGFVVDPWTNDKLLMTSSRGGYLRRVR